MAENRRGSHTVYNIQYHLTVQIEEYIAGHNEEDPGEQFTVDAE